MGGKCHPNKCDITAREHIKATCSDWRKSRMDSKNRMTEQRAREQWKSVDAVCFDVDSTVCRDEAIDELAEYLGKGPEVKQFTKTAMSGSMRFGESLRRRLEIIQVTRTHLDNFITSHPIRLTPGIQELVAVLKQKGVPVYLVSGGFREIIEPVARLLELPLDHVFANRLIFDDAGKLVDFDRSEPTSDSGSKECGKPRVCGLLKERHGYKNLVMVGDGSTDLEASPPADLFIGFGGNVVREPVRLAAPWYVRSFSELMF